jgi:serine/threonine-protein kinase RsbW
VKKSRPTQKVSPEKLGIDLPPGVLLELVISSSPTLLCVVRGTVERLAGTLGFSPEECRAVTLALDEAIANVIRHSYGSRDDQPIGVYFRKVRRRSRRGLEEGLEILLRDRGPAVDPAKLCGRDLDDVRPGGLGLHFIRQSMDKAKYRRAGDFNEWRLTKYITPAKPR